MEDGGARLKSTTLFIYDGIPYRKFVSIALWMYLNTTHYWNNHCKISDWHVDIYCFAENSICERDMRENLDRN